MANNLKELFLEGLVKLARLPSKNDYLLENGELKLSKLDDLLGYTIPLIAHDYGGARTPVMWNSVYESLGLRMRNIMVVADPDNAKEILSALKKDPKYLGGGAGVGFKEKIAPYLDSLNPEDLKAINIIVKEAGNLVGYNTDAQGLVQSIEERLKEQDKSIKGSNFVVFGAGGVSHEFTRLLAQRGASTIGIVNRTVSKSVRLATELNEKYYSNSFFAYGVGEHLSRGIVLNSEIHPDVIVNTTDKGSDGPFVNDSMFYAAGPQNENISRGILRYLKQLRPTTLIVDIVLPKSGRSISLRLAQAEGLTNLLDGTPMVTYQAVPAYKLVEKAHPELHKPIEEQTLLDLMKKAV